MVSRATDAILDGLLRSCIFTLNEIEDLNYSQIFTTNYFVKIRHYDLLCNRNIS